MHTRYFLNPSDHAPFDGNHAGQPPMQIDVENRGFLYGDGGFSTAKLRQGSIIYWQRHLARLMALQKALKLNLTAEQLEQDYAQLSEIFHEIGDATVKIMLSRGVSARGYALPKTPAERHWLIYPSPKNSQNHKQNQAYSTLQKVGISPYILGQSMPILRGLKTLNRLEQVMQKAYADEQGWQELICLDVAGNIVEGIASNCFFYDGQQWVTPDLAHAGIDGTMRQEILSRMQQFEIPYRVGKIHVSQLAQMQAGFFCNALNPMQVIENIEMSREGQLLQVQFSAKPCMMLAERLQLQHMK